MFKYNFEKLQKLRLVYSVPSSAVSLLCFTMVVFSRPIYLFFFTAVCFSFRSHGQNWWTFNVLKVSEKNAGNGIACGCCYFSFACLFVSAEQKVRHRLIDTQFKRSKKIVCNCCCLNAFFIKRQNDLGGSKFVIWMRGTEIISNKAWIIYNV